MQQTSFCGARTFQFWPGRSYNKKNGGKERPFAAMVGYFWPALDRSDRVVVVGWPLSNKNNDAKKDIQYAGRGAKEITAARADFWRKWRPRKK